MIRNGPLGFDVVIRPISPLLLVPALVALVVPVMPVPAWSAPAPVRMMPVAQRTAQGRSMSDTVRRVQRTTRGQILGVERVPFDGRDINRVKYLDKHGRVRYMDDPAPASSLHPSRQEPVPALPSPRGDNS